MKIICLSYAGTTIGGGQEYLLKVAKQMIRRGHHVEVITTNVEWVSTVEGIEWHRLWIPFASRNIRFTPQLKLFVWQIEAWFMLLWHLIKRKIDVVIANDVSGGLVAWIFKFFKPVYIVLHGVYWATGKRSFGDIWRGVRSVYPINFASQLITALRLYVVTHLTFTHYFVNNPCLMDRFGWLSRDKFTVTWCGVDLDKFKAEPLPKKYDVAYVGRLTEEKGVYTLIEALKKLKDVSAVIVGEGYYRAKLEEIAKGLPIVFTGRVSDEALGRYYAQSRIFCLPSTYEGFGIVVAEASLHRVPSIVSDLSELRSVWGESVLYFKPNNSEQLAECIKKLLSNGELQHRLSEKGKELVLTKYTWDKVTERMLRTLR